MRNKQPRTRKQKILWTVASIVGACLITTGVYAGVLYYKANRALDRIAASPPPTATASPTPTESSSPSAAPVLNGSKPFTFLLTGLDNRSGSDGSLNTDVMMVAVYEPTSRKVSILSLPRDLKIISGDIGIHKANYFYAYYYIHDKDTVFQNTKQFYSRILQMDIDHMILINFEAFRKIVDELGGLEINVPMDMRYVDKADGTDINLKKGLQKLDGKNVLDFVRYRKSNRGTAESSDFSRNERQQEVLNLILGKLDSLKGIAQWGDIIDILGNNIRTDIEKSQLKEWILNYPSLKPSSTDLFTLDTTWDSPYAYVTETELESKVQRLRQPLELPPLDHAELLRTFGTID